MVQFDIIKYRRLIDLYEKVNDADDVVVNPSASEFKSFIEAHRIGRMLVDGDGNTIIWDAYNWIHEEMKQRVNFHSTNNLLTQVALYAYSDTMACRLHEMKDEEVHPILTDLARKNPNLVRVWGPQVTVIDIHGEP